MFFVVIGAALSIFGVLLAAFGVHRFRRSRGWPRTTATVTGVTVTRGMAGDLDTLQAPIARYEVDGRTYELRSEVLDNVQSYSPGRPLPLRYDPQDPQRAVVDLAGQNGIMIVIVATVIALFGIALLVIAVPRV